VIRRYLTPLRLALAAGDLATAVGVFVLVSGLRFTWGDWDVVWMQLGLNPWYTAAVAGILWVFWLWLLGTYRLRLRLSIGGEVAQIFEASCLQAVFIFALLFLLKADYVSRLFLLEYFAVLVGITIAGRAIIRQGFFALRRRGFSTRYALIVGTGEAAQEWADLLETHRGLGIRVVGHLTEERDPQRVVTRPVLGSVYDLETVLADRVVDEVGIALPQEGWGLVQAIAGVSLEEGKIVRIPLRDGTFSLPGGKIDDLDGLPVLSIVRGPERFVALAAKRALDVLGGLVGLILLSPLFLFVWSYIRLKDGAPAFYHQTRVGLNGRPFTMVKFRTMTTDADAHVSELLAQNEMSGALFKVTNDPRITPWGRVLRKTSIDELPQLWNVLRGEMSLVGPRPPLAREVTAYDLWHRRKLSMRPGITGLQQVEGRRDPEFDNWVTYDLDYIDRWSLWLDLGLLLRTVPAVVLGNGR
jgi:exopolysaccharide biosynthesis polyprenyl glycosylphosphotransferase